MPSSTATNVAGPTGRLVGPTSRLAGPTQPAPETNSILEFRASCFAHLAFASSPHPATFLHTSRVSCVLHLLHPVQRVRGPPSGSDPNSRIHCTHSTNSTPSSPFHYCAASVHALCWLCLGPLPQPLLCRWRTPCLLPTLTTATLSPARGTPSGARGSGRLLKYCCLLASKSECCMGCRQAACFGWMLGVGVRGARLLEQHHLLHSLGSLGLLL